MFTTGSKLFLGATVLSIVITLAGAIALGPRLGRKFKRDGGGMPPGGGMDLAAINRGVNDVFGAHDIGLDRFKGVVFAGRHLL